MLPIIIDNIVSAINFGHTRFNLQLIEITVDYSFNKKYKNSYIKNGFLSYSLFLALHDIQKLKDSNSISIFRSSVSRYKNNPIIGDVLGYWEDHCKRLIQHEMAHMYERMIPFEMDYHVSIKEVYGLTEYSVNCIHHNRLWSFIYQDLMNYSNVTRQDIIIQYNNTQQFKVYFKG